MTKKIFSLRLKALRKAAGLTQLELSKSLHISISNINNYETGVCFANTDTLLAICDYFSVTADYMLGRTDDPYKNEINPNIKIA